VRRGSASLRSNPVDRGPLTGRVAPGVAGTFEVGVCACTAYDVGPTPLGAAATILVYRPTSTSAIQ
jgi:hypothetical protein